MALIWLRVYPVYNVLGFIFDLDKSNICRNLKPVLAVLHEQLGDELSWPDKHQRQKKMAQFLREFPEVAVIIDATTNSNAPSSGRPCARLIQHQ